MPKDPLTPMPPRKKMNDDYTPQVASLLQHISDVCKQMRDSEAKVVELGIERRRTVTLLREHGITWRTIAEWANTTEQALFKHHNRGEK
jgi:hypothetical protein